MWILYTKGEKLSNFKGSRSWRLILLFSVFALVVVACGGDTAEEEVVEETTVSGPIEDFSLEQLKNAWNEYSERLQNNNDVGFFYNSFVNVPIELKDKTSIYFTLHSATEEKEWQNRKPDLLEFLRNKLQNFALTISWEVKVVEGTVKYYTNRDKFVRMAEKNPTLLELKKRLNLELE